MSITDQNVAVSSTAVGGKTLGHVDTLQPGKQESPGEGEPWLGPLYDWKSKENQTGQSEVSHQMTSRVVIGLLSLCLSLVAHSSFAASLPDTVQKVKRSILAIGTQLATGRTRISATGWVVADGLHVVTNAHAIRSKDALEHGENIVVLTPGKKREVRRRNVEVVQVDETHDLALLRMRGKPLPALKVGNSQQVREGELYAFTGFPIGNVLGLFPVTHRGIVSAITPVAIPQSSSRSLSAKMIKRLRNPFDVLQLDATAYPGNSGSPLYAPNSGVVFGVINKVAVKATKERVLSDPSAITYAIPAKHVLALLKSAGLR